MALVSPGLQLTITDESQYLPTAVGTVPFVVVATSENKKINNVTAPGTLKANAGKVYGITSQRELATTFGYPLFRQSSAGTPLHGNELNEYGLMAAYSALGLGNRVWVVRANIDLDQLVGTSTRPTGNPADGTNWFDTSTTSFGLFAYTREKDKYDKVTPTLITKSSDCELVSGVYTPKSSIGSIGDYAVNVFEDTNSVFYKATDNVWKAVGSAAWKDALPVASTTTSTISLPAGSAFNINGTTISYNPVGSVAITSMSALKTLIDTAAITGITTNINSNGQLEIFAGTTAVNAAANITSATISTVNAGSFVVGRRYKIKTVGTTVWASIGAATNAAGTIFTATGVGSGTGNADPMVESDLSSIGISRAVYGQAEVQHSSYASVPEWSISEDVSRPTGSIWIKTTAQSNGANLVIKKYNSSLAAWNTLAMPMYADGFAAINNLDPLGGGVNISVGTSFVKYNPANNGRVGFKFYTLRARGVTKVTGGTPGVFTSGNSFSVVVSVVGTADAATYNCTINGTTASDFVAAILAANIPNVTAQVENGAISITHKAGGIITLSNLTGTPIATAGFNANTVGVVSDICPGTINLTNWIPTVYTFSNLEPSTDPVTGSLWYYMNPADVDVMINTATGWKGYRNVARDARGYDLSLTDPNGVIVSPTKPTTQSGSSGSALKPGDLWLDTSDLENYPKMYRYNVTNTWDLIDNTDKTSQNGIAFADARWGATGTVNPISDAFPTTASLLTSDYLDLDAPDYRLFPRGTLLFNTRRSGYTVKRFVVNHFNTTSFNVSAGELPDQKSAWVSQVAFKSDGSPFMGHLAQRQAVVAAMKAAVDGNLELREEGYQFNILTAPGYPELVSNLVALNRDRAETGFIIGDTPMDLVGTLGAVTKYGNSIATGDANVGLFYPSALTTDLSGNEIAVPASHMMLRVFLHSDNMSYQWFAPAGTRRGLIDNANAIGYVDSQSGLFVRTGVSQQLRDALYELRINPITLLPGSGIVAYGQKTLYPTAGSALDRINVARLVNYLRTVLRGVANQFLFEPNDKLTRDQVKQTVESVFNDLVAKRGVYDYLVVCDTTNNTPDRIARNELYVDVAVEPMKDVEFIYIPIRLKNPGSIAA
jgi:hypothetical protein